MIRFSVIDCVEKTGTLITGIYGTIDPQPSDGMPEKTKFRAIEEAKGPAWYKHELIQLLTLNDIKCFTFQIRNTHKRIC
ncbi:MAG TPA: hypothetical protein VJ571_04090 [Candidatus Nitrosotalea sp.]|nr:hypothetical protein [Candidatus Nitrosotalea sp.]